MILIVRKKKVARTFSGISVDQDPLLHLPVGLFVLFEQLMEKTFPGHCHRQVFCTDAAATVQNTIQKQYYSKAILFKSNTFHKQYFSKAILFKSNTFQKQYHSKAILFKSNTIQKQYHSKAILFKSNTIQKKYFSKAILFKSN